MKIGLLLITGVAMEFKEGYVYHIKDSYFFTVNDDKLMQNKESGNYRPTYFCVKDSENPSLFWVVPMSTQIEKYESIQRKQLDKYGKCLTIIIGEFDGKTNAFLLQNMFPITEKYISHIHTRNNNPVPVGHSLRKVIETNMKQLRVLISRGKKVVFPDVLRLEQLMIDEIRKG
jgi:hypothetical protein